MKISEIKIGQTVMIDGDVATVLEFTTSGKVVIESPANGEELVSPSKLKPLQNCGPQDDI